MAKKNDMESPEELGGGAIASINNILMRMIAVFAASGLSVIGAGAVMGISTVTAVLKIGRAHV